MQPATFSPQTTAATIPHWDVAVVGSGPAGASAAWRLAQGGCRVVLLEKARLPRSKPCGGGLVGRARQFLPGNFQFPVERLCSSASICLNDRGPSFTAHRERPIVTMVMRDLFDQALTHHAADCGATIMDGCQVRQVRGDCDRVRLETDSGPLTADWLIAADGVNSPVAKGLGWKDGRILAPAMEWEIPVDAATMERFTAASFFFGTPADGYAWVFPKQQHLSVGLGSMRHRTQQLPVQLRTFLAGQQIVANGTIRQSGQCIPVSPRRAPLAGGRTMLVGDAAGLTDPLTAEGLTFALQSGQLAADAILMQSPTSTAVDRYRALLAEEILPEIRCGLWLATIVYRYPGWRNRLLSRHGQRFSEGMVDLVTGKRSYRQTLARFPFWLNLAGLR